MGIFNRVKEIVRAIRFSGSPRLYGRYSAGAGDGEEIRIGNGLQISGGYLIVTGAAINSVSNVTTSDGSCDLEINSLQVGNGSYYVSIANDGNTYHYDNETSRTSNLNASFLQFTADGETLSVGSFGLNTNGSVTVTDGDLFTQITPSGISTTGNITVSGTLFANHIHGNIAGTVYAHVRAGENLLKGDPVYVFGYHSGTGAAIVMRADAGNSSKMPAIGIMGDDLANNANGHMVILGTIENVNTAAFAVNDTLYVANGGGTTKIPPAENSQSIARVERVNSNNGAFIVKINGLASSGGNGAADAYKLARFNNAGLLPASSIGVYHQVANSTTSASTTYATIVSVTLPAGTYQLDAFLADRHTTGGCKIRLASSNPIKTALTDSSGRPSATPAIDVIVAENFTASEITNATSASTVEFRRTISGIVVVPAAGSTITLDFAQLSSDPVNVSTARYGTHIVAKKLN